MSFGATAVTGSPSLSTRRFAPVSLPVLVPVIVMAAAVAAAAELVLHRIGAPIASHVPGSPGGADAAAALRAGGELAAGAAAVLVTAGAASVALALRRHPLPAALVGTATVTGIATALGAGRGMATVHHAAVIGAVVVAVGLAVASVRRYALAGSVLGLGVVAGQWPLLAEAVSPGSSAAVVVASRTVAEAALVAAVVLFAAAFASERNAGGLAWASGAIAAVVAAVALAAQPEHSAIVSLWAMGVSLSLPAAAYVAAAGAAGLLAVGWLAAPEHRLRAAGLVLVLVAGVQPAVVHHNLTALLGIALLAVAALGEEQRCRT